MVPPGKLSGKPRQRLLEVGFVRLAGGLGGAQRRTAGSRRMAPPGKLSGDPRQRLLEVGFVAVVRRLTARPLRRTAGLEDQDGLLDGRTKLSWSRPAASVINQGRRHFQSWQLGQWIRSPGPKSKAWRRREPGKGRAARNLKSATFFHGKNGTPWKNADAFRDAFDEIRLQLAKAHPLFDTRYHVGLDPDKPLSLPTAKLTMRTIRHTCATLLHAGVPHDLMPSITGHEPKNIDAGLLDFNGLR
jgi:hypothetical protein